MRFLPSSALPEGIFVAEVGRRDCRSRSCFAFEVNELWRIRANSAFYVNYNGNMPKSLAI
jgi:hypothetical protein